MNKRRGKGLPLALTMGDPAGVGLDITIAAWMQRDQVSLPPFYLLANPYAVSKRAERLNVALSVDVVSPDRVPGSDVTTGLPVVPLSADASETPGTTRASDAAATIEAIETAVTHVRNGLAGGVVTNPINKKSLYDHGFSYPGHTEFLGHLASMHWPGEPAEPVMLMAAQELKTVPVTVHIPLTGVAEALTKERIVKVARIVHRDLVKRFGIPSPRIALAGLNPHAGEGGTMGREDMDIVEPAATALINDGINADGPLPADTLFHEAARSRYDCILAMYHDQALIPVKTLAFDRAVNVTLGLPFVRTSPDHGTALDIAGTGTARPDSLIEALKLAAVLVKNASASQSASGKGRDDIR